MTISKRLVIWIPVVIASAVAVAALLHIRATEDKLEGKVTYRKTSGDFMEFLTRELRKYGGGVTNAALSMRADWRYAADSDGFQIDLPQRHRAELVRCLTSSLGKPLLREHYPHLVYKEDRFGIGIFANLESDPIHIICLRKGALGVR